MAAGLGHLQCVAFLIGAGAGWDMNDCVTVVHQAAIINGAYPEAAFCHDSEP